MTRPRHWVFLDADVLAAPRMRTLILIAGLHKDARYKVCWSGLAEQQGNSALLAQAADHYRRTGEQWTRRLSVTDVRVKHLPDMRLVAEAPEVAETLVDTAPTDRPILAAAAATQARVVVTDNVADFGRLDLQRLGMSAVTADMFMAFNLTPGMYVDALTRMLEGRVGPPYSVAEAHQSLSRTRPVLTSKMRDLFPDTELEPAAKTVGPQFRGTVCIVCGRTLTDPISQTVGVGPACRTGQH